MRFVRRAEGKTLVYYSKYSLLWLFWLLTLLALSSCASLFGDADGVKEKPREDVIMAMKVKSELIETSKLSAAAIEVEASHGRIRLSGFVESDSQRQLARDVASRVNGVKEVINDIEVK